MLIKCSRCKNWKEVPSTWVYKECEKCHARNRDKALDEFAQATKERYDESKLKLCCPNCGSVLDLNNSCPRCNYKPYSY